MKHLSPEELLDIADGTADAPPHLAACEACLAQLADLRHVMSSVVDVDVPEPSPLFWDHLSARVSSAIAAEEAPGRGRFSWWRIAAPVAAIVAVAAIVVAVSVARRGEAPPAAQPSPVAAAADSGSHDRVLLADPDDSASLAFVVDLANDMDMDTAEIAGLTTSDAADHAVSHLSDDELRTLAQLLKEQLPNGRAS
jgi:anti-sigma-K factor RskA